MEEARLQKQEGSAETIFIQKPSGRPASMYPSHTICLYEGKAEKIRLYEGKEEK